MPLSIYHKDTETEISILPHARIDPCPATPNGFTLVSGGPAGC